MHYTNRPWRRGGQDGRHNLLKAIENTLKWTLLIEMANLTSCLRQPGLLSHLLLVLRTGSTTSASQAQSLIITKQCLTEAKNQPSPSPTSHDSSIRTFSKNLPTHPVWVPGLSGTKHEPIAIVAISPWRLSQLMLIQSPIRT